MMTAIIPDERRPRELTFDGSEAIRERVSAIVTRMITRDGWIFQPCQGGYTLAPQRSAQ